MIWFLGVIAGGIIAAAWTGWDWPSAIAVLIVAAVGGLVSLRRREMDRG